MRSLLILGPLAAAWGSANAEPSGKLMPLRRHHVHRNLHPSTVRITGAAYDLMFDSDIEIGGQSFKVLLDTGSSDIWVVKDGYECVNGTSGHTMPQKACNYANATYTKSSTFTPVSDLSFGGSYGAGNIVGEMGLEDVTFADITIKQQTMGFVERTTNPGSGIDSGILGLGFKSLTSQHAGEAPSLLNSSGLLLDRITYQPLFQRMVDQGAIEPWFSMAIDRLPLDKLTGPGGYMGLGELPPVEYEKPFVTAPVEITESIPAYFTNGTKDITEWSLSVEGVYWGPLGTAGTPKHSNTTRFQAIVDSGQPANLFPREVVDAIHNEFDPVPVFDEATESYLVSCNATVPSLGVKVGGKIFYHEPEDLIMQLGNGVCASSLQPTAGADQGIPLNFLGDAFMRNVVSVFDFGKKEMRFAARKKGSATSGQRPSTTTDTAPGATQTGAAVAMAPLSKFGLVSGVALLSLFNF